MAKVPSKSVAVRELGVASEHTRNYLKNDEFIPSLRGRRAIKKYREMRDNDPIIGAVLTAMDMMLRRVDWRIEPASETPEAQREADFVHGVLFEDMSHSFEEFMSQVTSMLPYGFAVFETVFKKRVGPGQSDPTRHSMYTDGRIGIRKLAPRAQWTIDQFKIGDDGGVEGVYQLTSMVGKSAFIPIEKMLLFRTTSMNDAPSGRSVLRNAYLPYYAASHIRNIESIAIERELNGLPVGRIPSEFLSPNATDSQLATKNALIEMLRDVKNNEQGFILLPSDLIESEDGQPTQKYQVDFSLMASNGSRDIDTNKVIQRYEQSIARTVLAEFLMLGQSDRGSFALSKSKADLFLRSLEGYLHAIAAVINRHLMPRLWALNGLDYSLMPKLKPGDVAPVDLMELGDYIQRISGAGATLFPDGNLENALLGAADLPQKDYDDPDLMGRPMPDGQTELPFEEQDE